MNYDVEISFVLICFMIGELLSEVVGWVGHGLILTWFKLCVLCLVILDSSLQSPGKRKTLASYISMPKSFSNLGDFWGEPERAPHKCQSFDFLYNMHIRMYGMTDCSF